MDVTQGKCFFCTSHKVGRITAYGGHSRIMPNNWWVAVEHGRIIVPEKKSEAAVERSFSNQGDVHADLRNKLDSTSVRSIMMVRMNLVNVFEIPGMPKEKRHRVE